MAELLTSPLSREILLSIGVIFGIVNSLIALRNSRAARKSAESINDQNQFFSQTDQKYFDPIRSEILKIIDLVIETRSQINNTNFVDLNSFSDLISKLEDAQKLAESSYDKILETYKRIDLDPDFSGVTYAFIGFKTRIPKSTIEDIFFGMKQQNLHCKRFRAHQNCQRCKETLQFNYEKNTSLFTRSWNVEHTQVDQLRKSAYRNR